MGLFDKKYCARCGKELGLIFGKTKLADGTICKDCNALLSPLLTGKSNLTLADIEKHIDYRQENQVILNSFKATTSLGDDEKVYFDDEKEQFVVSSSKNFIQANADVLQLDQISNVELNIEENQEEIFDTDKEGKQISFEPKQYDLYYSYKINLILTHPWIKSVTIDINRKEVNSKDKDELLRIDNLANEIYAKLLKKEFIAKDTLDDQEADQDHWKCPNCGQLNENPARFCTNCGEPKAAKAKFCGNCGIKLPEGTKFCPNCGKAVS